MDIGLFRYRMHRMFMSMPGICVHVPVRVQVHIHVLSHFPVPEHERKHEYFVNNRQLQVWSNYNKRQIGQVALTKIFNFTMS
jgi:hypothetical protein